tara:strand:- start:785 stop:967 length:183 start_codon:yes stop_codon:yes gene_type:complete
MACDEDGIGETLLDGMCNGVGVMKLFLRGIESLAELWGFSKEELEINFTITGSRFHIPAQ